MSSNSNSQQLDLAEMTAIKATRAFTDPIIVNERTKDWALPKGNDVRDMVPIARALASTNTPIDERVEYATWPEVLCYCSTASMDERFLTRSFRKAYQYAFRRYLEKWSRLDPDEQPDPINTEPDLTDRELEDIGTLRFAIKRDLDRHFVENRYDELGVEGIPKSFWLRRYERRVDPDNPHAMTESAMSDIVDGFVDEFDPAKR